MQADDVQNRQACFVRRFLYKQLLIERRYAYEAEKIRWDRTKSLRPR